MEAFKGQSDVSSGGGDRSLAYKLPLGEAAATFDLQKAVCSHGFFMTAPNHWDPLSKTLQRPLRLLHSLDRDGVASSSSVTVQISQPPHSSHLLLRVFDTDSLSPANQQSLMEQVRRMLRLSEEEEKNVRKFQEIYAEAKASGFGRIFRSPTLFEDMVKCILVCNCQWSRTLSMARALCELQLELRCSMATKGEKCESPTTIHKHFSPETPGTKEARKRKIKLPKKSRKVASRCVEVKAVIEADAADCSETDHGFHQRHDACETAEANVPGFVNEPTELSYQTKSEPVYEFLSDTCRMPPPKRDIEVVSEDIPDSWETNQTLLPYQTKEPVSEKGSDEVRMYKFPNDRKEVSQVTRQTPQPLLYHSGIGNFPSPKELAALDVNFLRKRCNLGYRADRILGLAQSVVEGRIQLKQIEEDCGEASLTNYMKLNEQLGNINGFGPFTRANVLMCLGFYHVIPSDSETLRHLNQVHGKKSTMKSIQEDIEMIYAKYGGFQFLVYWSEIWGFYEERFGKLSELPQSDYKLITAANMRCKSKSKCKALKK